MADSSRIFDKCYSGGIPFYATKLPLEELYFEKNELPFWLFTIVTAVHTC